MISTFFYALKACIVALSTVNIKGYDATIQKTLNMMCCESLGNAQMEDDFLFPGNREQVIQVPSYFKENGSQS